MAEMSPPEPPYPLAEEIASAITHGLGALLSIGRGRGPDHARRPPRRRVVHRRRVASSSGSLVLLYTASTLYHAIPHAVAKSRLKTFDHCAIYVLIAGTYTPFLLGGMRGGWGWVLFATIWALAAGGVVFKLFFTGRFTLVSTLVYVAMGWLIVLAAGPMRASLPASTIAWLVGGGLAYTAGTAFYLNTRLRFAHAIWHLFVLAGSVCHFAAVLTEVLRTA